MIFYQVAYLKTIRPGNMPWALKCWLIVYC